MAASTIEGLDEDGSVRPVSSFREEEDVLPQMQRTLEMRSKQALSSERSSGDQVLSPTRRITWRRMFCLRCRGLELSCPRSRGLGCV